MYELFHVYLRLFDLGTLFRLQKGTQESGRPNWGSRQKWRNIDIKKVCLKKCLYIKPVSSNNVFLKRTTNS